MPGRAGEVREPGLPWRRTITSTTSPVSFVPSLKLRVLFSFYPYILEDYLTYFLPCDGSSVPHLHFQVEIIEKNNFLILIFAAGRAFLPAPGSARVLLHAPQVPALTDVPEPHLHHQGHLSPLQHAPSHGGNVEERNARQHVHRVWAHSVRPEQVRV